METYKFKLYQNKRSRYLKRQVNASGVIYNHCIALHKRYYRMYGKHLNKFRLQKHIAKLRNKNPFWQQVGSQAAQDIVERIEKAYQLFFKYHKRGVRPPSFKKVKKYSSFTLKQAGYKFLGNQRIKIGPKVYQFWESRKIEGKVKTVTVKRTPVGEVFIYVVTDSSPQEIKSETGKIAGFDFGLKTFLTTSEDFNIESPLFFNRGLREIRKANKELSRKKEGSSNWHRARINLARKHEAITHRRKDWFWKLAHRLTDEFDVLVFETLNLDGMKRLWGKKVSDLALRTFLDTLKYVAEKKGKLVVFADKWYPSSKTCNYCNHKLEKLPLEIRRWRCPECQNVIDRDKNAALNLKQLGHQLLGEAMSDGLRTAIAA